MAIATQEIAYTHALLACQLDREQIDITILHSDTEISLAIGINHAHRQGVFHELLFGFVNLQYLA